MNIMQTTTNSITILSLNGTFDDLGAIAVEKHLEGSVTDNTIVLDMEEVDFLDSRGLCAIVAMAKRMREHGGDVKLARLSDRVRQVFEITRVKKLFHMYDDIESAVRDLPR